MTFTGTQPGGLLKTSDGPLGRPHPSGDLLPATARRPSPARPGPGPGRVGVRFAPRGPSCPHLCSRALPIPRRRLTALVSARRRAPNSRDTARTPDMSVLLLAVPPAPASDCACASSRARPGRWDSAPAHHGTTPAGGEGHCACAQDPRTVALRGFGAPRSRPGG